MDDAQGGKELFGRLAIRLNLISSAQLNDALDLQRRLAQGGRSIPIGKIMLAKGYLSSFQIEEVLEAQSRRAVRCATCGTEFAVTAALTDDEAVPEPCPQCKMRVSPVPQGPGHMVRISTHAGSAVERCIAPNSVLVIGRSPGEGGVSVDDRALSRRHCRLIDQGVRLAVEDLGSRNGTFLRGEKVAIASLRVGDEIIIGSTSIRVLPAVAPRNTTELWQAEGLCMFCGVVVASDDIAGRRAQVTREGIICARCLEVAVVPGRTLGMYRIIEQIGSGGMAEVYRAEQEGSGRIVAIKTLLDPQGARDRFMNEARACAKLEHPNLVRIFDTGEDAGILYIVLEYIDGRDLAALLDEHGRFEVAQAIDIGLDIASALAYAHAQGVIHRDVKPGNIILDSVHKRARLLDLGVAKLIDSDAASGMTRTGIGLGTLDYAAPEQIESAKAVDHRTDVYSLGATIYRTIVGARPFKGANELALARAIIGEPLRWPKAAAERIPHALIVAVSRAMEKNREKRYRTASEFRDALAAVRESLIGG